jgi:hypothetical protein
VHVLRLFCLWGGGCFLPSFVCLLLSKERYFILYLNPRNVLCPFLWLLLHHFGFHNFIFQVSAERSVELCCITAAQQTTRLPDPEPCLASDPACTRLSLIGRWALKAAPELTVLSAVRVPKLTPNPVHSSPQCRKVLLLQKAVFCWVLVVHSCNAGYSVSRDWEDRGLKPARANSSQDPQRTHHRKGLVEWLK